MGKQASLNQRAALANALNTSGQVKAAPPLKEKEKPVVVSQGARKKKDQQEEPQKTKKDIEEEQRLLLEENERKKAAFYADEAAKKVAERRSANDAVTFVEDKDSRKPKAVGDISEYWVKEMNALPFLPSDNAAFGLGDPNEDGIDPHERLVYLISLNEQLEELLRLRFHIFWSQVKFDKQLRRCLDSYLRFCLRSYDLPAAQAASKSSTAKPSKEDTMAEEEQRVSREISRRMLAVLVRLSRPEETSQDFLSSHWYGEMIRENGIFDVPKLIDICAIYGDSNREAVTKLVHSVFHHQPLYNDDFKTVVQHILGGLHQCCAPLQGAATGGELSVEDCLAFLPDILSCFNAIFCFFPEDCVELLLGGSLSEVGDATPGGSLAIDVPLADLMVRLHNGVLALEARSSKPSAVGLAGGKEQLQTVRSLLSRLLSLTLGFRFAPRRGPDAFTELIEWLKIQADNTALMGDICRHGLEHVAMDWLASGLVDDAQLDFLEELCGPVLGAEARRRRPTRPARPAAVGSLGTGAGAAASSSSSAAVEAPAARGSASTSGSDKDKIRSVKEVVGQQYGDGFILQCLLNYGSSVPAVVGAIVEGSLPPHLKALPTTMQIGEDLESDGAGHSKLQRALSSEDKQRTLMQAGRIMERQASEEYNDDYDDGEEEAIGPGLQVGGSDSDHDSQEDHRYENADSTDEEQDRWAGQNRGKGGKLKGKGKGKGGGKSKDPVQGQTIQARRKEANKASVANHNRREGAAAKMRKGMF